MEPFPSPLRLMESLIKFLSQIFLELQGKTLLHHFTEQPEKLGTLKCKSFEKWCFRLYFLFPFASGWINKCQPRVTELKKTSQGIKLIVWFKM